VGPVLLGPLDAGDLDALCGDEPESATT